METIRIALLALLLLVVAVHIESAAVKDERPTSGLLSRVKRENPKNCKGYNYLFEKETTSDEDAASSAPKDCKCSFDECSCLDKSSKGPKKPQSESQPENDDWLDDIMEDVIKASDNSEQEPSKEEPSEEVQQESNGGGGKGGHKQTFNEYFQSRQRQEVLNFLKNYYSTVNKTEQ